MNIPYITNVIYFDYGSSVIKYYYASSLGEVAARVKEYLSINPDARLIIRGYADPDGTADYNYNLSLDRAKTVRNYVSYYFNIPWSRIEIEGKGSIHSELARQNPEDCRRVEFVLIIKEE